MKVGVSICEDAWSPSGPILAEADGRRGAGRQPQRVAVLRATARASARRCSRAAPPTRRCRSSTSTSSAGRTSSSSTARRSCSTSTGDLVARAKQFVEDLLVVDLDVRPAFRNVTRPAAGQRCRCPRPVSEARLDRAVAPRVEPAFAPVREVYEALVLGTRDYVRKNGFTDVLIGLSGGIDSALVAAIAVDALGAEHVIGRAHAVALLERAQRRRRRRARREPRHADATRCRSSPRTRRSKTMLTPMFEGTAPGRRRGERAGAHPRQRADDDLEQVRLDGADAPATRARWLPGYATLYGDMAGGFAVIKDVPKTLVYALCDDLNERAGPRADPAARASRSRRRRSSRPVSSTPTRCRRTTCSIRSSRATSKTTCRSPSSIARGYDADARRTGSRAWSIATSTSGARRRPACACRRKAFGKDRRLADHQSLARLTVAGARESRPRRCAWETRAAACSPSSR